MVTVLIESTITLNGREVTSNPKMYEFKDETDAVNFVENLYDIDQGTNSENRIQARILDYTVNSSGNAVPLMLHSVHYDHAENPADGVRYLEDIDVLTVEEIEDFRARGIKQEVVAAYDNPESIEAIDAPGLKENSSRFDTLGVNLFDGDPDITFHLSFNPEIGSLLREKYGHSKEAGNDAL